MPAELVPREPFEQAAEVLYQRYAGFESAENLSVEEKLVALASHVPLALQIVEEARETIARLRDRVEELEEEQHGEEGLQVQD